MPARLMFVAPFACAVLAGCASPSRDSDLPAAIRNQPFPQLLPLEGLLADAHSAEVSQDSADALNARARALQARAAALRAQTSQ